MPERWSFVQLDARGGAGSLVECNPLPAAGRLPHLVATRRLMDIRLRSKATRRPRRATGTVSRPATAP